ncbi:MAG: D-arabinono-1,4-lactone oxidase [Micropepsaceae bacterium]
MTSWTNWSGLVRCEPKVIAQPANEIELADAIRSASSTVRCTGSGHSFTELCQSDDTLISLDAMQGVVSVNASAQTATLKAGTKVHAIGRTLHDAGFGLCNQGDIDRQSIAGAVSTGTHGTGPSLGSLSSMVAGFRLVTASGEALECSPKSNTEIWEAGRVSFGTLGVMSEITMQVRPAYKLREENWLLRAEDCWRDMARLRDQHRHFEFFWFPLADAVVAKSLDETTEVVAPPLSSEQMFARGERVTSDQRIFEFGCQLARLVPGLSGPLQRVFTRAAAAGGSRCRWSHEIFPSPRTVRFNEMEYSVPAANGVDCIREVAEVVRSRKIAGVFPIEFRFVKADDIWLSPFYKRDAVTISVHQYHKQSHDPLFQAVEPVFRRYGGRPHWGKLHTLKQDELSKLYPQWHAFQAVRRRLDPDTKFLNSYLRTMLGVGDGKAA